MTLYLRESLACVPNLRAEGIRIAPSSASGSALRVGLLNLMPKKQECEEQILRLLSFAGVPVEMIMLTTASYVPKNTAGDYLQQNYLTFAEIDRPLDGLIVTGAPLGVRFARFEEVAYWSEISTILDSAQRHQTRLLGICWGAQAMLYHRHGIPSPQLPSKLIGLYQHRLLDQKNPLVAGLADEFWVPVARKTATLESDLARHPSIRILADSPETGPFLIHDSSFHTTCILNHIEYDTYALKSEYLRDIGKGLATPMPKNYFANDDVDGKVINSWRSTGSLIYGNWLRQLYFDQC